MRNTIILLLTVLLCRTAAASVVPSSTDADSLLRIPLPENTFDISINDSLPLVYIQSEKINPIWGTNAIMSVYSLTTGEKQWERKFHNGLNRLLPFSEGVIFSDTKHLELLDNHTGKKKYSVKGRLATIAGGDSIMIMYQGKKNDNLVRIEPSSGKIIWKTKIGNNYGIPWTPLLALSDSVAIYMGDHIWRVDTATGDVREYKLRRQRLDKATNALSIGLGVLSAVAFGAVPLYTPTYFEGLGSEVVTDGSGRMYVADQDAVACIDTDLNEVWRTPLPKGLASNSELFIRNDTLDMLNTAIGFSGIRTRNTGKRFFASFSIKDGSQISLRCLPETFDKDIFGENINFVPGYFFVYDKMTSEYKRAGHRGDAHAVAGQNGYIHMIDSELNILETYSPETIFLYEGRDGDNIILKSMLTDVYSPLIAVGPDHKIVDILTPTEPLLHGNQGRAYTIEDGTLVEAQ